MIAIVTIRSEGILCGVEKVCSACLCLCALRQKKKGILGNLARGEATCWQAEQGSQDCLKNASYQGKSSRHSEEFEFNKNLLVSHIHTNR